MGTLAYIFLVAAIIFIAIAVVSAVLNAPWRNWVLGAAICFIVWLVLTLLVHV